MKQSATLYISFFQYFFPKQKKINLESRLHRKCFLVGRQSCPNNALRSSDSTEGATHHYEPSKVPRQSVESICGLIQYFYLDTDYCLFPSIWPCAYACFH